MPVRFCTSMNNQHNALLAESFPTTLYYRNLKSQPQQPPALMMVTHHGMAYLCLYYPCQSDASDNTGIGGSLYIYQSARALYLLTGNNFCINPTFAIIAFL